MGKFPSCRKGKNFPLVEKEAQFSVIERENVPVLEMVTNLLLVEWEKFPSCEMGKHFPIFVEWGRWFPMLLKGGGGKLFQISLQIREDF